MVPGATDGKPRVVKSCLNTVVDDPYAGKETAAEVGAPVTGAVTDGGV